MFRTSLACLVGLCLSVPRLAAGAEGQFDEQAHDFGTVPRGVLLTHTFRLMNNSDSPLRVVGIRVSCGCTTASVAQAVVPPRQSATLLAQMDTRRFAGTKTVTIFVNVDQPSQQELRVAVSAHSREDFSYTSDGVNLGKVQRGQAPSGVITITRHGEPGWQLVSSTCDSNYISTGVKASRRANGEIVYELTARLRPDIPVGRWFTDIWLQTDQESVGRIRVPVTVEVDPPVTASPAAVTMGEVKVGEEVERTVELRGSLPFRVVEVRGADRSVQVKADADEDKATHTLTVKLRPEVAGDLRRSIQVVTSLREDNVIELPVHAVASR